VDSSEPARVLKRSPARSVRLEARASDSQAPRIVKRFRSQGPFAAARDRARAEREIELLRELHGLGLSVPRPIELVARDGGWEVAMEFLAGAAPFSAILEARAAWPADPGAVARELGALCARLAAAGVDHPDLHPGNALVDDRGRAFAIDFHKARRVSRLSAARLESQLVRLAAGARERTSRRFRARFLWAWWKALPPELRPAASELPQLARRVEVRGRRERAAAVEHRRPRWTRDGTAVRAVRTARGHGFERADREPGLTRALEMDVAQRSGDNEPLLLASPFDARARVLILRGSWRDVSQPWYAAGRLEEHALPAARALAACKGPRAWAAFELPNEGRMASTWNDLREPQSASSLGELAALFHDRGVVPASFAPASFWVGSNGEVCLCTTNRIEFALDVPARVALDSWSAALGARALDPFTAGFRRGLGLGSTDQRELDELLRAD
jgi:tRNA A-37 threonylcarbamoyl transferase component Bud32